MPLKTEPVSASESPDVSVEGAVAIRGCQALLNPRPTSYSSALLKELPLNPPATSTLPEGSSVAVCKYRAVLRLPVLLQLPVAGSYSSAKAHFALHQFHARAGAKFANLIPKLARRTFAL